MAAWIALQLLRGTSVRNRMNEMASHALLLEVILGGRTRLREVLSAAGEPVGEEAVNRKWIGFFKNPIRAEVRANHHMQHLANMLPRVTISPRSFVVADGVRAQDACDMRPPSPRRPERGPDADG